MSFRRRNYSEVMDNLLTSLVKGVSAEEHPFPSSNAPYVHSLERSPAVDIIAVYGSRNGQSHAFVKGKDYALSADGTQLQWMEEGGHLPLATCRITVRLSMLTIYPDAGQPGGNFYSPGHADHDRGQ
ncbi:MAG: hypothetical protein JEZ12_27930 [Desulfobacterium sp.]|nr:hypothetical protein [Desulfobacterium sp.]